jgi:hypothetical protein
MQQSALLTYFYLKIRVSGREVTDVPGTMQPELTMFTGSFFQPGTSNRWGDYSTMQVDPLDDRTFWYINQYSTANSAFRFVEKRIPF